MDIPQGPADPKVRLYTAQEHRDGSLPNPRSRTTTSALREAPGKHEPWGLQLLSHSPGNRAMQCRPESSVPVVFLLCPSTPSFPCMMSTARCRAEWSLPTETGQRFLLQTAVPASLGRRNPPAARKQRSTQLVLEMASKEACGNYSSSQSLAHTSTGGQDKEGTTPLGRASRKTGRG